MIRKHEAMYAAYGKDHAHKCKDCTNCVCNVWDKRYYKCLRYGESSSEATDWGIGKVACGMFNVPLPAGERPMVKLLQRDAKEAPKIDGQQSFLREERTV